MTATQISGTCFNDKGSATDRYSLLLEVIIGFVPQAAFRCASISIGPAAHRHRPPGSDRQAPARFQVLDVEWNPVVVTIAAEIPARQFVGRCAQTATTETVCPDRYGRTGGMGAAPCPSPTVRMGSGASCAETIVRAPPACDSPPPRAPFWPAPAWWRSASSDLRCQQPPAGVERYPAQAVPEQRRSAGHRGRHHHSRRSAVGRSAPSDLHPAICSRRGRRVASAAARRRCG